MENLIQKLNSIGQQHFPDTTFYLKRKNLSTWIIEGNSIAKNIHKNNEHEVKVLKWFNDFWLYLEIKFKKIDSEYKKWSKDKREEFICLLDEQFLKFYGDFYQTFITLSIFQGNYSENKTQLFRAEWDNYEEFSENHPQPHWHIYPYKYTKELHDDFEYFIELTKTDDDFRAYVTNKKDTNIIDLKKLHFAMNGQWSENKLDVHKIQTDNELTNWFSGILNHIKKELFDLI